MAELHIDSCKALRIALNVRAERRYGEMLVRPVTQAQVSQWLRGVSRVTLEYALEIGRISKGKVTPVDLASMYRGAPTHHSVEVSE